MNILVLYTRLTGYWMACMRKDHELQNNTYLVYRTPPSKEAPFKIESELGISIKDYKAEDLELMRQQIEGFQPHVVYIAGWANKQYLKIAKFYKDKGLPVITGMDNHWLGTWKQHLACMFSKRLVLQYVSYIWVPGQPQYYYARKLGFQPEQILTGLYCADDNLFKGITQDTHNRQLIFIGRIVDHKGVKEFFEVLEALISENVLQLNIHIIGSGPLEHLIPKHKNITHTPFVAPEELPKLLANAGTFILPSLYEAWGVVVHEAALAGLPIVTTYQCGAGTEFVIDDFNGHTYDATDKTALKTIIKRVATQQTDSYFKMSKNSKHIAGRIDLVGWSAQLNSLKKQINV